MMGFTLTVRFRGMHVFVPDFEAGGTALLHVLIPATGHDPHRATLKYAGKTSGEVDLAGQLVTFTGLRAGPGTTIDHLARLGRYVPRSRFDPQPADPVAARVRLPAWNEIEYGCAPTWEFGSLGEVPLTNDFTFVYTSEGDAVTMQLSGNPVTLQPAAPGGSVELSIDHLPVTPPPCPGLGKEAPHFGMLYPVCHDPTPGPSPKLKADGPCKCQEPPAEGGSPYTCLAGQAPPGP